MTRIQDIRVIRGHPWLNPLLVAALLLFGVTAHVVFAPGFAVKSFLEHRGLHPPNAVGVASTVALWWAVIAVIGLAWEWRGRRPGSPTIGP